MTFAVRSTLLASTAAAFLSVAGLTHGLAAQTSETAIDAAESQAREAWRETIHQNPTVEDGCFQASYPSTAWQRVQCASPSSYRSAVPDLKKRAQAAQSKLTAGLQTVGNGFDFVAQAPTGHLISAVTGSFPTVTGVTSEQGVNVPFGGGESNGHIGSNEYSLQVNTNLVNTRACNGYSACLAWQQYVLASDTGNGTTGVLIEYWLINYGVHSGRNICPKGFMDIGADGQGPGDDCVQNSATAVIYKGKLPITDLAQLKLTGTATLSGTDKAVATFGTTAYTASVADSYTDIASAWSQAEFNVVGNAGGSQAAFNTGASITTKIALTDGSTTAPTCVAPGREEGTTGETNNLTLGTCTAVGGATPSIQFVEHK